jgi:hypothetical protein
MPTKTTLALLLAALLLPLTASAKTVTDPKSDISVDLPEEGWKIEEGVKIGGNVSTTATSDDGVMIIVMRIDRKLPAEVMKRFADEMFALMNDAKIGEDADKTTLHGLQADKFSGHALREEKPVRFTCELLSKDSAGTLAVIAVGPETYYKRHLRDIDAALDSPRPK